MIGGLENKVFCDSFVFLFPHIMPYYAFQIDITDI